MTNTLHFSLSIRPRSRSRDSGDENDNIQERHFRPHFLQAPGDLIVQEGRLCRMDCKVNTRLLLLRVTCANMSIQCDLTGREGRQLHLDIFHIKLLFIDFSVLEISYIYHDVAW